MTMLAGSPESGTFSGLAARGQPAQVDQEAQVVVLVGLGRAGAERGGDVPRHQFALPLGVLRGHAAHLAGPGQVGHRGAVAAGVDVRGVGHLHELIDHQPAPVGGQVQAFHQRVGADPDAPDQRPGGHLLAGGQLHVAVQGVGDRLAHADLDAAAPQHPVGGLGQPRVQLGQQPRGGVQQHPPDLLARQSGHRPGQPGRHQLALRRDLGAGVARADHHECAARLSAPRGRWRPRPARAGG